MPTKCKLLSGKYRLIGPDGDIEKNNAGTAIDGGGHATMEACRKQMTVINLKLGTDSVLIHEGALPFATSSKEDDTQRFKKDMIKVGVYVHPVHKWKLDVTSERLHRWLAGFKAMRENGVDIEVPLDHSLSAEKNLGYVVDCMIEKDFKGVETLFGIIEVAGKNAIDIIRRNKNVSVWIAKDYTDGEENYYGEVIKHCAVVQQPVITRQDNFIPIAASETGIKNEIPIFYQRRIEMTKDQLAKLKTLFGLGEDVTEESVLSAIETQTKSKAEVLKKIQDENIGLKSAATKNKAASTKGKIDPNTLELAGSAIGDKIQLLVERGSVLPEVAKRLSEALIGAQGSRKEMMLSLGEESAPSIASQVVDILKDNDPIKLGEQTKAQVLNRDTPGIKDEAASEEGEEGMACGAGIEEEEKKK